MTRRLTCTSMTTQFDLENNFVQDQGLDSSGIIDLRR